MCTHACMYVHKICTSILQECLKEVEFSQGTRNKEEEKFTEMVTQNKLTKEQAMIEKQFQKMERGSSRKTRSRKTNKDGEVTKRQGLVVK